jgi:4-carboxymuconolactone decarboxylase
MVKQDHLDPATAQLVRFAAAIAQGHEADLRECAVACRAVPVPDLWVDELLLQSLLMVGYPRALIAFAIWRTVGSATAPASDPDAEYGRVAEWTARGEATCRVVYGANYRRLRQNVQALHPALDAWMMTEGYGRTMSRPGLDLVRREFCVVAQTSVMETPRQLHSHLRGALHAGATRAQVEAVLALVNPLLSCEQWRKVKELWATVKERWPDPDSSPLTADG